MESVSPYRIILTAPGGWTSGNGAVMKVSITDKDRLGWQTIEYRINDGNWVDCENLFADGRAELTLHENGTFTLRVTDPHGHAFEENADVKCIDLTAPVLTTSINGTTLQVDAKDDLSGVAGVQVNSMLFTTLVNGTLNVELDQNMNQFEKLAVRAFDYAGNFSEPVTLTNPHYEKPADPTPVPKATPKPTKKPADEATATPTAAPAATNTPAPNRFSGLGSSLIYVQDEPDPTPEPTAAPTPETIIKTEYITIGPGMPYQADGNSHTVDEMKNMMQYLMFDETDLKTLSEQVIQKLAQMSDKVRLSQNNYQLVAENAGQSPEVLMNHYNEALDYEKRALSRLVENSFYPHRETAGEAQDSADVSALMAQIQQNPELCRKLLQSLTLGAQQRA